MHLLVYVMAQASPAIVVAEQAERCISVLSNSVSANIPQSKHSVYNYYG